MDVNTIVGLAVTLVLAALSNWVAAARMGARMETQLSNFQAVLGELKSDVHQIREGFQLVARLEERVRALEERVRTLEARQHANGGAR